MAEKKTETPRLEIHYVPVEQIIEAEYNPRKISPKKKKELRDSIEKYGLRDSLKINTYKGRENILISGHQRLKIAKEMGFTEVPVTHEFLNLDDEKEMNLRFNKNGGEFDLELVATMADRADLLDIGFSEKELPKLFTDFEEKFNGIDADSPVYPITPKFNEKYDFLMIFTESEMDFQWLKNLMEVEPSKEYKTERVGDCRVINVKKFQELHKLWTTSK